MERLSQLQKSIITVLRVMDQTQLTIEKAEYESLKNRQKLISNSKVKLVEMPPYWQKVKDSEEHELSDPYWVFEEGVKSLVRKNLRLTDSKAFDSSFCRSVKSLRQKGYINVSYSTKKNNECNDN